MLMRISHSETRLNCCINIIMGDQAHYNVRQSASHAKSIGITQRATPLRFPWVGDLRVRCALPQIPQDENRIERFANASLDSQISKSMRLGKTVLLCIYAKLGSAAKINR